MTSTPVFTALFLAVFDPFSLPYRGTLIYARFGTKKDDVIYVLLLKHAFKAAFFMANKPVFTALFQMIFDSFSLP